MKNGMLGKSYAKKHIKSFLKEYAAQTDKSFSAILIQPYEEVSRAVMLYLSLDKMKRATIKDLGDVVDFIEARIGNMQEHLTRLYSRFNPPRGSLFSQVYVVPDPVNESKVVESHITLALKAIRALYYHVFLYKDYGLREELNLMVSGTLRKKEVDHYSCYIERLQKIHFLNLLLLEDLGCENLFKYPLQDYYGVDAPSSDVDWVHFAYYKDKWYIYFRDSYAISPVGYLCSMESIKVPRDLFAKDNLYRLKNNDSINFLI